LFWKEKKEYITVICILLQQYLAALPDEVKTMMTEAFTLIAARTYTNIIKAKLTRATFPQKSYHR